jgi:hypothetical protein
MKELSLARFNLDQILNPKRNEEAIPLVKLGRYNSLALMC